MTFRTNVRTFFAGRANREKLRAARYTLNLFLSNFDAFRSSECNPEGLDAVFGDLSVQLRDFSRVASEYAQARIPNYTIGGDADATIEYVGPASHLLVIGDLERIASNLATVADRTQSTAVLLHRVFTQRYDELTAFRAQLDEGVPVFVGRRATLRVVDTLLSSESGTQDTTTRYHLRQAINQVVGTAYELRSELTKLQTLYTQAACMYEASQNTV